MPSLERGTDEELGATPPCFRCLFEKPITENWCDPRTCEMLDFWLADIIDGKNFNWDDHATNWVIRLTMKRIRENEILKEE